MAEAEEEDVQVDYKRVKEQESRRSKGYLKAFSRSKVQDCRRSKGYLKAFREGQWENLPSLWGLTEPSSDGVWARLGEGSFVHDIKAVPSAYLACMRYENLGIQFESIDRTILILCST